MAGKTYSAGTIFLQVVPVFGDTMDAIRRETKDWNKALGDEAEKGGKRAGQRAAKALGLELEEGMKDGGKKASLALQRELDKAVGDAQKAMKPIDLRFQNNDVKRVIKEIKGDLADLGDVKIKSEMDARQVIAKITELRAMMASLKDDVKLNARADFDDAFKAVDRFGQRVDKLQKDLELEVRADFTQPERALGAFEKKFRSTMDSASKSIGDSFSPRLNRLKQQLEALGKLRPGVDIDTHELDRKLHDINMELAHLAGKSPSISIRTDAAAASATLAAFRTQAAALDGKQIDVGVDVDTGLATAQLGAFSGLLGLFSANAKNAGTSGDVAANSFRSFNGVILAAVVLLPALIPMIGALGGGLLALIPILGAVGAGLGVAILGFSGISDAVKAMGDVQKNGAKDAEAASQKMRDAALAVEDAERSLSRARTSAAQANADAARATAQARQTAARQIEDALDRQRDAEEELARAQRDAAEAQRDLREARRLAQQDIEDAADRRRQNALDERQGVVDVFNAQVRYTAVSEDGGATNLEREEAAIALEQARLRLKNIRDEQKTLAREKAQTDRQGVNGTDRVRSAQDRLVEALERQRDAQEAVGDAAEAVKEARISGARAVADAVRNQQRTEASGAQSVADAHRNLARAQMRYQDALVETETIGSESMRKLEDAMGKLGPAGRDFARFIYSLRQEFHRLRAVAQEGLLPGVQQGLETIIGHYGPRFTQFVGNMARVMGNLFALTGETLTNPSWQAFFAMVDKLGPLMLQQFGETSLNWLTFFADLMVIVAPFAERLALAMLEISESAVKWIESAEGTKFWTDFMKYAAEVGPEVMDFFKALVLAAINIGVALAPWGEMIMNALTGMLEFIATMDPKTLGLIAGALMSVFIAFSAVAGGMALFFAGGIIFSNPVTLIVFALLVLVGALAAAYVQFEGFREIVDKVLNFVGALMVWTWENVLKPVFKAWWEFAKFMAKAYVLYFGILWNVWSTVFRAMKWVWQNILSPVFSAIISIVKFLWHNIFSPILGYILGAWRRVFGFMKAAWNMVLFPVIDLIMKLVWKLWVAIFKVALEKIQGAWSRTMNALKWVWTNVVKPMLDLFMEHVGTKLVKAFRTAMAGIKAAWEGLKSIIGAPVRFVIDTIINKGLIRGFNKIAKAVGSKQMDYLPVPEFAQPKKQTAHRGNFARGGIAPNGSYDVYPGYTPGRDIGYIGVSGGEAIMRPEWTQAVGPDTIAYWNSIARAEGAAGIKKRMAMQKYGNFARGGVVWPVPGRRTSTYKGHDGVDINRGSGWDDYGDPIVSATGGRVAYVGSGRGYGKAIFINSPYGPLVYGHASMTAVRAGQMVNPGTFIGRVGNTGNSSAPHLHFGFPGGSYSAAMALLTGAAQADLAAISKHGGTLDTSMKLPGWITKMIGAPKKFFLDQIDGSMQRFSKLFGGGEIAKTLSKIPGMLIEGMVDKVLSWIGAADTEAAPAGAAGPIQEAVRRVADTYGWSGGAQWNALVEIVNRESGWNPSAANPTSSARGLFQKMTSIHGPLESSVAGQAEWGLQYIFSRYGSPIAALRAHNAKGWYSEGGVVGEDGSPEGGSTGLADNGTMMYDNGGYLPPGLTTVVNLTGKPEPVFTAEQFERMGGGGDGFTYAPTFNKSDLTAEDVAEDLNFTITKIKRGGKYGGKG